MINSILIRTLVALLALVDMSTQSPLKRPQSVGKWSPPVGEGSRDQADLYAEFPAKTISSTLVAITSAPIFHRRNEIQDPVVTSTTTSPLAPIFAVAATSTTTSAPPIPTKVNPKCNVQGYASAVYQQRIWGNTSAEDVLACQLRCLYTSQCQSYSFQLPSTINGTNCVFYAATFDATNGFVIPDSTSPLRFSDKYPTDGSNYCYGDHQL